MSHSRVSFLCDALPTPLSRPWDTELKPCQIFYSIFVFAFHADRRCQILLFQQKALKISDISAQKYEFKRSYYKNCL